MTEQHADSAKTNEATCERTSSRIKVRRRLTSIASVMILTIIFVTPLLGLVWLRRTAVRESEVNALWHTQTMLIRHLVRTRGGWPASWDDLEADFQPTNHSQRTDKIDTLKALVDVDFKIDPAVIDMNATDDLPKFISLKSGRLPGESAKANRQLQEYIGRLRSQTAKSR